MNLGFESFVNSEECKTLAFLAAIILSFESFVNSEECKTFEENTTPGASLRALLIQKSVKQQFESC